MPVAPPARRSAPVDLGGAVSPAGTGDAVEGEARRYRVGRIAVIGPGTGGSALVHKGRSTAHPGGYLVDEGDPLIKRPSVRISAGRSTAAAWAERGVNMCLTVTLRLS
jgi:hypothetical protein